ncbi:hypothetical protein CVU83_00015 [Candidatus Falkowbacteria bacterium HGW-Falkowbacteria-2]|uniref:Uncharacterized protein n=1 Tax=Candidatus Falkowbacteria bacterium HGW-Falkowbacteria-2 TaxID=2013769 RepID=A0A2N2E405_9BACT|nr:MAG: hypothetical protein CVU83_00015 [Candidatus Falkowbacteria bacterium HGW-Falkowbacteria-2]
MKENFNVEANILGTQLNEALDRKNRRPLGETPADEDEEIVDANNPKYGYKTVEDIADNSYEGFGEEEGSEEADQEIEESFPASELASNLADYKIEELNPEVSGPIGAASISGSEKTISINREEGREKIMSDVEAVKDVEMMMEEGEEEKYEELVESADSRMRAESFRNGGQGSRINVRQEAFRESHAGDNLKTMPEAKKQRSFRSIIRNFIKPSAN